MKRQTIIRIGAVICTLVMVLGAVALASIPAGCATASSPVENNAIRYYQAESMYTSTVRTMTALAQSGKVDLQDAERFEVARISASRLLNRWRAAVQNGDPWNEWDSLESILEELIQIQIEATTAPS